MPSIYSKREHKNKKRRIVLTLIFANNTLQIKKLRHNAVLFISGYQFNLSSTCSQISAIPTGVG